ncbi:hypothetical protein [Streptomyces sp. NPDC001719]
MRDISRREILALGLGTAAAVAMAACEGTGGAGTGSSLEKAEVRLIGDGSTADTGKQPHQPGKPVPLDPGQPPPQFVIFSWDGGGEVGNGLFPRFLQLARDHGVSMTFFLSGLYLLPESRKFLYHAPNNNIGDSDIGYLTDGHIKETLKYVRQAWNEGHEIGTHFNGHFCRNKGSVEHWTPAQWQSEIDQAISFVTRWKSNTGWVGEDPLPFDYKRELVGGRTPCLLGQDNLLPTARKLGWRYDASSPGGTQVWPGKRQGLWDLPLQQIPFPGHSFQVLSMDYNILVNQSKNSTNAPSVNYPGWRKQATEAYLAGFRRAYETNRAPLFIGNHFEQWNGGIYMDAVEEALKGMADEKDVRLVSFRQFCDWLDVQNPRVLEKLRTLGVGELPAAGWNSFFKQI